MFGLVKKNPQPTYDRRVITFYMMSGEIVSTVAHDYPLEDNLKRLMVNLDRVAYYRIRYPMKLSPLLSESVFAGDVEQTPIGTYMVRVSDVYQIHDQLRAKA